MTENQKAHIQATAIKMWCAYPCVSLDAYIKILTAVAKGIEKHYRNLCAPRMPATISKIRKQPFF